VLLLIEVVELELPAADKDAQADWHVERYRLFRQLGRGETSFVKHPAACSLGLNSSRLMDGRARNDRRGVKEIER
jgi:hypothetical protein